MVKSGFSGVLSGRIAKRRPVDLDEFHAPRGLLDPLDGLARLLDLELERPPRLDEALDLVGIPPRQAPTPGQDAEKGDTPRPPRSAATVATAPRSSTGCDP